MYVWWWFVWFVCGGRRLLMSWGYVVFGVDWEGSRQKLCAGRVCERWFGARLFFWAFGRGVARCGQSAEGEFGRGPERGEGSFVLVIGGYASEGHIAKKGYIEMRFCLW